MDVYKKLHRIDEDGIYCHIYNKGVEKGLIFKDEEDYKTFLGYLEDYLSAPQNPESTKKEFTVNGRVFRGIPHQPKNYFKKVELVAYSLMPDRFNIVLYQTTKNSIERFIRSLCTRYSMYFNKKYQHTGTLFEGPYKSVQIKEIAYLPLLTRYIHLLNSRYSSYPEYLDQRQTSWVKKVILDSFGGTNSYKSFVENHKLDQKEKEYLKAIIFEEPSDHLERRIPELERSAIPQKHYRIPEFIGAVAIFLILVGSGVRNIKISSAHGRETAPAPQVSGVKDEQEPKEVSENKPITVIVRITDGAESVNVREEPSTQSKKIGEVFEGEVFEFVSINSGWYQVKLKDGSTGFISARYINTNETAN